MVRGKREGSAIPIEKKNGKKKKMRDKVQWTFHMGKEKEKD